MLVLGVGVSTRTACADGLVDYTVTGTYATGSAFASAALSNPGDSFSFTFSVDPTLLPAGPVSGSSVAAAITFDYTDSLMGTTIFSLTNQPGTVTYYLMSSDPAGLFDIDFTSGGDLFVLQLTGVNSGFFNGTTLRLNTGKFYDHAWPDERPRCRHRESIWRL